MAGGTRALAGFHAIAMAAVFLLPLRHGLRKGVTFQENGCESNDFRAKIVTD